MSLIQELEQRPEFVEMTPQKQEMVRSLIRSLDGVDLGAALPVVMLWKQELAGKNLSLTPKEDQLLSEYFYQKLTPEGRAYYEQFRSLF